MFWLEKGNCSKWENCLIIKLCNFYFCYNVFKSPLLQVGKVWGWSAEIVDILFQVRLYNLSDDSLMWKKGSFLKKNVHIALLQQVRYVTKLCGLGFLPPNMPQPGIHGTSHIICYWKYKQCLIVYYSFF